LLRHLTTLTRIHAWKLREFDVDLLASSSLPCIQHIHIENTPMIKRTATATVVANTLVSITLRVPSDITSSITMETIALNLSRAKVLEKLELHGQWNIQGAHGCAATLTSLNTCTTAPLVNEDDTRRFNANWSNAFHEWYSLRKIDISGYLTLDSSIIGQQSASSWIRLNLSGCHRMNHTQVSSLAAIATSLLRLAPPSRDFVRRLAKATVQATAPSKVISPRAADDGTITSRIQPLPSSLLTMGLQKFSQLLVMIPSRSLLKQITWPIPKNCKVTNDGPNGTIVYSDATLGQFVAKNRLAWLSGEQLGPFHKGPPCGMLDSSTFPFLILSPMLNSFVCHL
jgi:hypothetical protein